MNAFIKGHIGSTKRVEGQGTDYVGRISQSLRRKQRKRSDGQHCLGSVDERDGFLGFQNQRLNPGFAQRIGGSDTNVLFTETLAFADQDKRKMCEGCKIAAGAHAALRWNVRCDLTIQQLAELVDNGRAHSRVALGKGIGAQKHHRASFCR